MGSRLSVKTAQTRGSGSVRSRPTDTHVVFSLGRERRSRWPWKFEHQACDLEFRLTLLGDGGANRFDRVALLPIVYHSNPISHFINQSSNLSRWCWCWRSETSTFRTELRISPPSSSPCWYRARFSTFSAPATFASRFTRILSFV